MATVSERIKALELELQTLRGMEQWSAVGRELREAFTRKYDVEDKDLFVTIGIEKVTGEGLQDWKIPFLFGKEALAKAGVSIQQKLDQFQEGQTGKR